VHRRSPPSFLASTKQGPWWRVGGEGQLGRRQPRDLGGGNRESPGRRRTTPRALVAAELGRRRRGGQPW
jgi:hypothetical protein